MNSGSCWGKTGGIELQPLVQYSQLAGDTTATTAGAARRVSPELRGLFHKGKKKHSQVSNTNEEFAQALERRLQRALEHAVDRPHGYGNKSPRDLHAKGKIRDSRRSSASKSDGKSSISSKDFGTSSSSRSTPRRQSQQRSKEKNSETPTGTVPLKRGVNCGSPGDTLPDIVGVFSSQTTPHSNQLSSMSRAPPQKGPNVGSSCTARIHLCNTARSRFPGLTPAVQPSGGCSAISTLPPVSMPRSAMQRAM